MANDRAGTTFDRHPAPCRHSRARILPHHHGPDGGTHSCRSRRRRDQDRAGRRRSHAPALRLCRRILSDLQPQQAQPGARPEIRRGTRAAASAGANRRRGAGKLRARHHGAARLRLCRSRGAKSAHRLLRAQGFPVRALRAPPGARRGGAVHGGAGLHDRAAGPAAARRRLGGRHHGRHVRGDRRAGGVARARAHRPRPGGQIGIVRIDRVPDDVAHGRRSGDRQTDAADAFSRRGVGDL